MPTKPHHLRVPGQQAMLLTPKSQGVEAFDNHGTSRTSSWPRGTKIESLGLISVINSAWLLLLLLGR